MSMGHFASAEPNGNLDLVAGLQKFNRMIQFCVKIIGIDVQRQAHLFDVDDLLILFRFLITLGLFKTEFTIVHNAANRRFRLGSNFDKVKIFFHGDALGLLAGNNPQLAAVSVDHPDLFVPNLLIDLQFLVANSKAPPKPIIIQSVDGKPSTLNTQKHRHPQGGRLPTY